MPGLGLTHPLEGAGGERESVSADEDCRLGLFGGGLGGLDLCTSPIVLDEVSEPGGIGKGLTEGAGPEDSGELPPAGPGGVGSAFTGAVVVVGVGGGGTSFGGGGSFLTAGGSFDGGVGSALTRVGWLGVGSGSGVGSGVGAGGLLFLGPISLMGGGGSLHRRSTSCASPPEPRQSSR